MTVTAQQTDHPLSPLDQPEIKTVIENLIAQGIGDERIAKAVREHFGLTTGETSIWRFRKRHSLPQTARQAKSRWLQEVQVNGASTQINGDTAVCATTPSLVENTDPDRMLLERGLNPNDWYIDQLRANEWGPDDKRQYQTRFVAKRKRPYVGLMPVRSDGWKPQAKPLTVHAERTDAKLVVICGDQQVPFHDKKLHALFCEWLQFNRPDNGVVLGDLGDFPDISRHPDDPENVASTQECLQGSYNVLREYVDSSPSTSWRYLLGNHDERIRQYLLRFAPRLYGLKRVDSADAEGEAVHNMAHLMRLDELGVDLVDPHGTYENGQVTLSKNLAIRHGWIVRQGSGTSALKTLEQTGYSVVVGHTHRQSCVYHTFHEIGGKARQLMAVEAGCMCRLDSSHRDATGRRFPSYTVHPDWQQGFATATLYPDGKFNVDLARFVNGTLLYREQRYQ